MQEQTSDQPPCEKTKDFAMNSQSLSSVLFYPWSLTSPFIWYLCSSSSASDDATPCPESRKEQVWISPERRFSCPKQQRSAGRCFSCCLRHWCRPSRTRRGRASPPSRPAPSGGTPPAAARLRTAATVEAAAPPRRSGSGVPCREGAGRSRCACSVC